MTKVKSPSIQLNQTRYPDDFMRKLLYSLPEMQVGNLSIFGTHAILEMTDGKRASIDLTNEREGAGTPHGGDYAGLRVTVKSEKAGHIDSCLFPFNMYLRQQMRVDNRADHTSNYQVLSYVVWDWYIAIPYSTKPLMEAISDYINIWK
jgi:hypothetical protein